jgi:4-amino-4-deoxy-L-arabinose transferase-like glycosyltransferase
MVYFLAKDFFGKRIALITGLIAALYVGLFVWTGWLYTETLYTFCLTGLVFSLSRLQRNILPGGLGVEKPHMRPFLSKWRWTVASGIFLGLVLLARPTGSILIGMLGLWTLLLIAGKILPWRPLVKNVLLVLLIALVINLPWLSRGYLVSQTIFPPSSVGTTLQGSYNDAVFQGKDVTRGMVLGPHGSLNPDFQHYTKADEQKDTTRAFNWMRTHVSGTFTLLGLHVQNMWTPYLYGFGLPFEEFPDRISSKIMFSLIPVMSIPIFLLAALGLVVTWKRRRKQLLLVYLVIALAVLQNMAFYGSPRFRAPIEPLVVLLVGGALWWSLCDEAGMWRHFGRRNRKKSLAEGAYSAS